jgi:hypothetical protein
MNYEKLLLVVGVLAVISQNTTVVFISAILLVGIPLFFFALIVFCNLLAMYPAVLLHRATGKWILSIPAAALGVVAVEYGVPAYADYHVRAYERALQANDFGPSAVPVSGDVEIRITGEPIAVDAKTMCESFCRTLLSSAKVKKVYVTNDRKAFAIELNHPGCRLAEDTPKGQRTHAFSHCYYASETKTVPRTHYSFIIERPAYGQYRSPLLPWRIDEEKTVETFVDGKLIASDKLISAEVASSPLFFNLKFSGGAPDDWHTVKKPYESRISRFVQ